MQNMSWRKPCTATNHGLTLTLGAVCSITGWSERTAWRRLSAGSITRVGDTGNGSRVLLDWSSVEQHARLRFDDDALSLLACADAGDADAQNDIALYFFERALPSAAIYWLQQAVRSGHADAMHWLGRCYLAGNGLESDRNLGLMWLARSASAGHPISDGLLHALCGRFSGQPACLPG